MAYPRVNTQKATAASAANASATATLAAPTDTQGASTYRWYISRILATTSGGNALVQLLDGATVIWQGYVSSTAPMSEAFDPPLECRAGNAANLTIGAAGAGFFGTVNLQGYIQ